jgi:uncharacterized small protein (DUF1192 family)
MSISSFIPKARTADLVVQQVDDETMVYDLLSHQAHCLNRTAAEIWKNCDGQMSVPMIAERIGKDFGAGVEQELVLLAVTELSERKLLENQEIQPRMANRREVLRKIAFGVVAAPIIYTLVAPSALASASCACVNPGACLTQTTCPSQVNCNGAGICAP